MSDGGNSPAALRRLAGAGYLPLTQRPCCKYCKHSVGLAQLAIKCTLLLAYTRRQGWCQRFEQHNGSGATSKTGAGNECDA